MRENDKTRKVFNTRAKKERDRLKPPPPPPPPRAPVNNSNSTSNSTTAPAPPAPKAAKPVFEGTDTSAALLKCGRTPPPSEILRIQAAIADIFAGLGGWEESGAAHEQVLAKRPNHVTSLVGKAAAAAALQDYASVGEAIETAQIYGLQLSLAASETKVAYGTALMELARGLIKETRFKESQALLRAALKVDASRTMPYAIDAWRLMCRSYSKQRKAESALYACARAHDLNPHLGDVQESLDWARTKVKEIQKDREGRERIEREGRERAEKEKKKTKEKSNDQWKWFGGDGEWRTGKGGGRGNKRGGSHKKQQTQSEGKRAPRGLYDILELKPSCKKADIKRAYHKLSLKWHPDKNPDKKDTPGVNEQKVAEEKFREIAVAYQELLLRHVDGAPVEDEPHCINC